MLFLTDDKHKIIFGWSAKCGCSHITPENQLKRTDIYDVRSNLIVHRCIIILLLYN